MALSEKTAVDLPKVSVVSTTYNHEAYIRETLDSFVAQQTDFAVEFIVADDASTDATPRIIQEYADRHPHLFRPILRSENLGLIANLVGALAAARGEYLAMCEGDDYWTDPLKLSKQVAFLDRHPKTAVCFHPVRVTWEDGRADSEFPDWRPDLSMNGLLRRNFIQTNSVMYRRLPRYDDMPAADALWDYYLHVRHALHGNIAMLPETMAVYRRHPQAIWYKAIADPTKFWLAQGPGHAKAFEAMLDLFPGDPVREAIVGVQADRVLRQIANVPGPEGRAALLDSIAQHPRFTLIALQHRWATPTQRLKTLLRQRAANTSSWRMLVDVYSARLKGKTGRARTTDRAAL